MTGFEEFERTYGPSMNCELVSADVIKEYDGLLPELILDHWRQFGWCAYGEGLIWFANPHQFDDVVEDWLEFESGRGLVFLRTAFAHLYLWHEGFVYSLDVQTGSVSQVTDDLDLFFSILCGEKLQAKILRLSTYQDALTRIGPPNRDECYAFVPALPLGGPGTPESVQRVKIREHLSILAQLVLG